MQLCAGLLSIVVRVFPPHSSLRTWSLYNTSQNHRQYQCERFECVMSTEVLALEEIESISEHLLNHRMVVSKLDNKARLLAWP